jgi:hypothetical protein
VQIREFTHLVMPLAKPSDEFPGTVENLSVEYSAAVQS